MDRSNDEGRTVIRFVASNLLKREIERAAAESGMTLSEFLRAAAREAIIRQQGSPAATIALHAVSGGVPAIKPARRPGGGALFSDRR